MRSDFKQSLKVLMTSEGIQEEGKKKDAAFKFVCVCLFAFEGACVLISRRCKQEGSGSKSWRGLH